jgi:hypothetical protein
MRFTSPVNNERRRVGFLLVIRVFAGNLPRAADAFRHDHDRLPYESLAFRRIRIFFGGGPPWRHGCGCNLPGAYVEGFLAPCVYRDKNGQQDRREYASHQALEHIT